VEHICGWCGPGSTGEESAVGVPWRAGGLSKPLAHERATRSPLCHPVTARTAPTHAGVGLGHPVARCLASPGRREGGWVCSELQMAEDFAHHRALRDDGDEPQCPALAQWTRAHL